MDWWTCFPLSQPRLLYTAPRVDGSVGAYALLLQLTASPPQSGLLPSLFAVPCSQICLFFLVGQYRYQRVPQSHCAKHVQLNKMKESRVTPIRKDFWDHVLLNHLYLSVQKSEGCCFLSSRESCPSTVLIQKQTESNGTREYKPRSEKG